MRHPSPLLPPEVRLQAAWPAPLAAVHTPSLASDLVRRCHDLLPRVAAYYTHLQALPRRVRRALQRQLGLSLATLALWLALGLLPVQAATIPVGGACTLVEAITAANTDTATGGCPAGDGADTIVLPAGSTQTLRRVHNDTYGPTGLPVIRGVITIAGNGSTIARASETPEFRLFAVNSTGALTLQETTVSGGVAPVDVVGFPNDSGGGLLNVGGTVTVTSSSISDNMAASRGGGVENVGGTLTVLNGTIFGNSASAGGGIDNGYGTCTITNSTISGNMASSIGGGVRNNYGTCTVTNSTISGNTAHYAGGVDNSYYPSIFTVTNSTISGNVARYGAGGVINHHTLTVMNSTLSGNAAGVSEAGFGGGGVLNRYLGTVTVTNSTLSGNSANAGGGMRNFGLFTVTNSTILDNAAIFDGGGVNNFVTGTLTMARTLVTGNTAPTGSEIFNNGTVVVDHHNLFGVNGTAGVEGFSPGPTDLVPPTGVRLPDILDPTLALHGGRTETHALVPGSPAIDAGGPVCLDATGDPLTTDQRGKPRPVDGDRDGITACDIGAFEFFPLVSDVVTLDPDVDTASDPTPVPGGPAGTFTVTATFTNTSPTPLGAPFFEVTALSGGNLLLNADGAPGGVGATRTPEVGDGVLSPGETVTVDFVIGLQDQAPFTFKVELFGEPVPEEDPSLSQVQVTRSH